MNLMNLTAVELGKKIKNKEVTVEEACKDAISRMNTMEGQVHSYVTVLEEEAILARAKEEGDRGRYLYFCSCWSSGCDQG